MTCDMTRGAVLLTHGVLFCYKRGAVLGEIVHVELYDVGLLISATPRHRVFTWFVTITG